VPNDPPSAAIQPGSGPRHLVFSPDSRFVYLINEIGATLTSFAYDAKRGSLKELQTVSTVPQEFAGSKSCAEVQIHPSGRFVYGSNRGHDSIAVYAVNPENGELSWVDCQSTRGKTPRHFAIDPTGQWLLAENQGSDNIVVFRLDLKTGRLSPTGQVVEVGSPVCAVFVAMN
jgi:6-phosphogluconolactonase